MLKHLVGLDGCWEPPSEGACSAWSRLGPKAAWDRQAAGRTSGGRVHHLLGGGTPATPVIDIKSKFGQHFPPVVGGGLKLFSRPLALQRKSQAMNHHKGPPTCTAVSGKLAVGAEHRPMLVSLVSNSTRWRGLENGAWLGPWTSTQRQPLGGACWVASSQASSLQLHRSVECGLFP